MAWRGSVVLRVVGLIAILLVVVLLVGTDSVASRRGGPVPCPMITGPVMNGPFGMTSPLVWANPCPGNSLVFGASNILTIDHKSSGRDQTYPIRLWKSVGTGVYEDHWRSEDVTRYSDALIGDLDDDGDREIVASAWCDVQIGKKKDKVVERRVWLEAYEPQSTGFPDYQGPEFFVIEKGGAQSLLLANIDTSTPQSELVVVTSYNVMLFTYDPTSGFHNLGSLSPTTGPVMYSGAVGDVDGDGELEVVAATSDANVYVWSWDGGVWTYVPSSLTALPYLSEARIGNILGDGGLEIVGAAYDYQSAYESYLFIWQWDPLLEQYALVNTWSDNFPGTAHLYDFDLADLDGDGYQEVVYGTTGDADNGHLGVLDFTGDTWITLWSTTMLAVANYVTVGDADGNANTVELIFAGSADGIFYLEVYLWTGGAGVASWRSTSDYGHAQTVGLG